MLATMDLTITFIYTILSCLYSAELVFCMLCCGLSKTNLRCFHGFHYYILYDLLHSISIVCMTYVLPLFLCAYFVWQRTVDWKHYFVVCWPSSLSRPFPLCKPSGSSKSKSWTLLCPVDFICLASYVHVFWIEKQSVAGIHRHHILKLRLRTNF